MENAGGSKSLTGAVSSAICSGSKCRCTGLNFLFCGLAAGWHTVSRDECSQVLNCFYFILGRIVVALYCSFQIFGCLDDSIDRRDSGSFYGMVILFPRVSCTHRSCLVGGIDDTIVFQ